MIHKSCLEKEELNKLPKCDCFEVVDVDATKWIIFLTDKRIGINHMPQDERTVSYNLDVKSQ